MELKGVKYEQSSRKWEIMFEVSGVSEEIAREALRLASHKLSVKSKFVKKDVKDGDSLEN